MPATSVWQSKGSERKFGRISGAANGSGDPRWMLPRLSGRHWYTPIVIPGSRSNARVFGSVKLPWAKNIWQSGLSSPGRLRTKP